MGKNNTFWAHLENSSGRENLEKLIEQDMKRRREEKRNIRRDERGRLNKGAQLAKKDSCNEEEIWKRYCIKRMSVNEIAASMGCSKSTVYNAIKKIKQMR